MNPTGKGGFKKGISGNPKGRKPRAAEDDVIALFKRAVSTKDQLEIIQEGQKRAKRGDLKWAQFIFYYIYGTPIQRSELRGDANSPLEVVFRYAGEEKVDDA